MPSLRTWEKTKQEQEQQQQKTTACILLPALNLCLFLKMHIEVRVVGEYFLSGVSLGYLSGLACRGQTEQ